MSDTDKAKARAYGALANFRDAMQREMEAKGRSDAYQERFWETLKDDFGIDINFLFRA